MKPDEFNRRNADYIQRMAQDDALRALSQQWLRHSLHYEYPYHFTWMGLPIIQFPTDIVVLQEIIWQAKPDLIIETGIARGGSVIFYAGLMAMMGMESGHVIGVDIDIRPHNRQAIEEHPLAKRITLLEGSSTDAAILEQVNALAAEKDNPLVILDSLHTHAHVLAELRAYAPLVKKDSYLIVLDTLIEDMPQNFYPNRPWGPGDNPKTAVYAFLDENPRFQIERHWVDKMLVTVAPDGFLRCIAD